MTGHASQLASLVTGVNCWITTRLLSHLLKLNGLANLKYLRWKKNNSRSITNVWQSPLASMHYTKDLSATVLFLVLKKASRLERIVGAESWHDMDPRWDAVQTYEIHSNSRLFSAFATRWMQFLKRDSFVTDLYHLTTMIMNIFIKNLCCIFLFSLILSISHVTVTNHIDRPNLNFDIT